MTTTATTELPDDLRDVRRKLEQLAATGRIDDLIELVVELLARMRASNNSLATRLANALRELYGRKSQKIDHETLSNLLHSLGNEVPASAAEAAEPPPTEPEKGNVPQTPGAAEAATTRRWALALARDAAAHVTPGASAHRTAGLPELRERAGWHRLPHE